jgi:phage terminase large subunit-like protein
MKGHDTSATNPVTTYARDVLAGTILAGGAVRRACQRHLDDLEHGPARGLRFDANAVARVFKFFSALRHHEGVHAGRPFTPLQWQQFIVGSLYGWMRGDIRRFRSGYVECGKGSGKSPLLAAMGLYALVADNESGAQVLFGATKREQAGLLFTDALRMVDASPMLSRTVERNLTTLSVPKTGSTLRAVSSEARTLDGWRPSFVGLDELHEHVNDLVLAKLRAGVKGRRAPLVVAITNAGQDRLSVCWQQNQYGWQVLEGTVPNDEHFVFICTLDPCAACAADGATAPRDDCPNCDSWKDERMWIKTNPSLPITPTLAYLHEQVREAIGMPAREALVRRLNFCEWIMGARGRWLDMQAWGECAGTVSDDELPGVPCYAGLDLGQSDDFTAFVRLWTLDDGRIVVRCRFWLPEAALAAHPTRPYAVWQRAGALIVTPGEVTDPDQVEADVLDLCHEAGVQEVAYDKRFAERLALHLRGQGLTAVDTPQGFQLNEALTRLAELVKTRKLVHGGDPILTWMASNALVRHGMRGEIRLDKETSGDKIDGIAALAMALSRAIAQMPARSVYEDRGVLSL